MNKTNMGLKNLTPKSMQCVLFEYCPALYKTKNSYVIIGKVASKSVTKGLKNRISKDEAAIEVPKKLFSGLKDYQN